VSSPAPRELADRSHLIGKLFTAVQADINAAFDATPIDGWFQLERPMRMAALALCPGQFGLVEDLDVEQRDDGWFR
jgi:hypothetical protein